MSEDLMWGLALLYTPLTIAFLILLGLSYGAQSPSVAKTIKISAITMFAILSAIFALYLATMETCDGGILFAARSCDFLPLQLANSSLEFGIFGVMLAGAYTVLLLIGSAIFEWRFRRNIA